ncbi:Uncharacterised protein (plasmid) [Legionella adelaidensis]|uniref:Uncharacterized protein n=1 Tax=Legionella adelaidensis TaxID=45056 RepID=A0A0W0R4V1_9GAMM|nr:hypothetical protein [Legionella adelaidensis]KTC66111.1 hypothetical protein Lade_0769 [Legionella adelaidensis]VEH85819.1 Uncharacterised protein [Legionella adelaidensis]
MLRSLRRERPGEIDIQEVYETLEKIISKYTHEYNFFHRKARATPSSNSPKKQQAEEERCSASAVIMRAYRRGTLEWYIRRIFQHAKEDAYHGLSIEEIAEIICKRELEEIGKERKTLETMLQGVEEILQTSLSDEQREEFSSFYNTKKAHDEKLEARFNELTDFPTFFSSLCSYMSRVLKCRIEEPAAAAAAPMSGYGGS